MHCVAFDRQFWSNMAETVSVRGLRLPETDGDKKTLDMWWTRFYSYAECYGFSECLKATAEADLPASAAAVVDETTDPGKLQAAARKRNKLAVASFTMAFQTESMMSMVYKSKTAEYPGGLAHLIVAQLLAKLQPKDKVARVEMRQALNKVSMKDHDDPRTLFEQISTIENKYAGFTKKVEEEDLLAAVIDAAPAAYKPLLAQEQIRLGDALTMADVETAMNTTFRTVYCSESDSKSKSDDFGLVSFGGECYLCHQSGHKAYQCPNKKQGGGDNAGKGGRRGNRRPGNGFSGKCNNCGKKGHKAVDCWLREENKDKRPKNFRPPNGEKANAAVSESSGNGNNSTVDFLLCGVNEETEFDGTSVTLDDVVAVAPDDPSQARASVDDNTVTPATDDLARGNNNDSEVALMSEGKTFPADIRLLLDPDVWIGDSAATTHSTPHAAGMHDIEKADGSDVITVGDGTKCKANMIASLTGEKCTKEGVSEGIMTMRKVTHLPGGKYNLFSIPAMLKQGWSLGGNAAGIWIEKDGVRVTFDIVIPTKRGMLFAMYFRRNVEVAGAAAESEGKALTMSVAEAHDKLGHANEDATRAAAKALGVVITRGTLGPCASCAVGKARQKNVPKVSEHVVATKDEGRVFLDIASVKAKKGMPNVTKPHWRIMVDERTQLKFSAFHAKKSDMVEPVCELLSKWKKAGINVKYVRCDNAGENKSLQARSDTSDWKLGLTFEFTARDTPQQNSLAEVGFATLANRGRAMMHRANVPEAARYKVWREAFGTATLLDGLLLIEIDGKMASRFEHWAGSNPSFAKYLRMWGEAGTVKVKTKTTPKLQDRGVQCMLVGYAPDHAGDCYRMWNPKTDGVHVTRDIIWLRRMFFAKDTVTPNISPNNRIELIDEGVEVELDTPAPGAEEGVGRTPAPPVVAEGNAGPANATENLAPTVNATPAWHPSTRSGRTVRPPARLINEMGAVAHEQIDLSVAEEHYYDAMAELGEVAFVIQEDEFWDATMDLSEVASVGAGLGGGFVNTAELKVIGYDEAMDSEDREQWIESCDEEHGRMVKHQVWEKTPRSEVPAGTKILTSTWAMKHKANGTLRARVNARGFEQVDGKHFKSHSISAPVTNDATIRIVFTLMLMALWIGQLIDVKGAFLHGELAEDEEIYMEVPKGFEKFYPDGDWVLRLLKTLYGLKQSAYYFWLEILKAFRSMGYERSKADPCLYYKWTDNGLVLWVSWIDDCLVVGSKKGVEIAKKQMLDRFDCDDVGNMDEYVGCKIDRNWADRSLKVTQPVLLQSYTDEFELPKEAPAIPAEEGQILLPGDDIDKVNVKEQSIFRSGVGKLMHMMRWSRPGILNAVRELSRFMTGPTPAHVKAMKRVMTYCVATAERGLFMKPNAVWDGNPDFEFEIEGWSDSNYAKCPITRRSVSGYSTFLNGCPVTMKSQMQKTVKLSVTESELDSGTSCAQDMLYDMRVVESIGLKVKKPMILWMDNKGAVDLANSWSVGGRTRHVDVKQYFLRELKEEGTILVKWKPGKRMRSDVFTKNLGRPLFETHLEHFVGPDQYMKYGSASGSQEEGVGGRG